MAYGLSSGHVTVTSRHRSRDPRRCCEAVRSATAWLLVVFDLLPQRPLRHCMHL